MTRTIVCILLILYLAAFGLGYFIAWDIQESRRLKCGQGWYETLELVGYLMAAEVTVTSSLPRCAEDCVIIGYGQFENGTWSDYGCGPAVDDYKEK